MRTKTKQKGHYHVMKKHTFILLLLAFVVGLCLGVACLKQAVMAVASVQKSERQLPIYSVDTDKKAVALGFNAAWDNEDIDELIEIFDTYGVRATFFVVGQWAEEFPESVKALHEHGHEVMNHSYSHKDFANLSREEIIEEVEKASDVIESLTGVRPTLFRMPSGSFNDLAVETVRQLGYEVIQWDADSIDWKNPTVDEMVERMKEKIAPGSITLFHSGAKNTPAALGRILEYLQAQGYEIVPVSQLILKGDYTIDFKGCQHAK